MELKSDIAIISAFGRGHWLAVELVKMGIPVSLLDVTGRLGRWAPEDGEGPFGFFKSSDLKDSQWERMLADDSPCLVPLGFTFWLPDGPLEMNGNTTAHRLQFLGISEILQQYLSENSVPLASGNSRCPIEIKKMSFAKNWLAQFAHSFAAVVTTAQAESISEGLKQDLFAKLYIRQASRQGFEKSLQWCRDHGVKVFKDVEIKDLSFSDKNILAGIEVRAEKLGIYRAENFVWCLSSEETSMLGGTSVKALFPEGVIEPDWVWIRYRFHLQAIDTRENFCLQQLPWHCVLIGDLNLSWGQENMVVLQRTTSPNLFDAWIRIPNIYRFQGQYLEEKGRAIAQLMATRIPEHEIKLMQKPIEMELTFQQLGPTRHPLFSRAAKGRAQIQNLKNVFFDSPEQWACLGWKGSFKNQEKILKNIEVWWKKKEELRKKRDLKDLVQPGSEPPQ